jgi:hypothetical protein
MAESAMDEDMQHLEENLHRLVMICRTLARDADAIDGEHWNEPYAYRAAAAAVAASRNLRRQLETRWLVSPLSNERPEELSPISARKPKSYPRVTERGSKS